MSKTVELKNCWSGIPALSSTFLSFMDRHNLSAIVSGEWSCFRKKCGHLSMRLPLVKRESFLHEVDQCHSDMINFFSNMNTSSSYHSISSRFNRLYAFLDEMDRPMQPIRRLLEHIDEQSYNAILDALQHIDPQTLTQHQEISHNKTFKAKGKNGENLFIKVTSNKAKAKVESAANYFLSQDERLQGIITRGYYPEPIDYEGILYITVQKNVNGDDERKYDIHYYMAALALFHSHVPDVLASHITLPSYKPYSFGQVLIQLRNPSRYKHLEGQYNHNLEKMSNYEVTLIHADTKEGNLFGVLGDLEDICWGPQPIDLVLPLVQRNISKDEWPIYLQTYIDVRAQESFYLCNVTQLTQEVSDAALLISLRAFRALFSRCMGKKEEEQAEILDNFICSY